MIALLRLFWEATKWGFGRTPGPSMDAAIGSKPEMHTYEDAEGQRWQTNAWTQDQLLSDVVQFRLKLPVRRVK